MSITISTLPPPTKSFLNDFLSLLLPPQLPLPSAILSTDLKTRHLYLPPSASTPDSYIQQRPTDSNLVDRLTSLAEEWEQAGHQEVPRASLHDRVEDLQLAYLQRDEHTILCCFTISPPYDTPAIEITLIHEGDSPGWLLFDTSLPLDDFSEWSTTPASAHSTFLKSDAERKLRNPRPEELDDDGGEEADAWEGNGNSGDPRGTADDFWGGYSDDEKDQTKPVTISQVSGVSSSQASVPILKVAAANPVPYESNPPRASVLSRKPSASGSTLDDPTDSYWSFYASVEDGLRASNPPTRTGSSADLTGFGMTRGGGGGGGGGSGAFGRGEERGYYGSGGETPVRWTPEPSLGPERREDAVVDAKVDEEEGKVVDLSSSTATLAATKDAVNGHTPPTKLNARQQALSKTLEGLYNIYVGEEGGDSARKEFIAVLADFGGRV